MFPPKGDYHPSDRWPFESWLKRKNELSQAFFWAKFYRFLARQIFFLTTFYERQQLNYIRVPQQSNTMSKNKSEFSKIKEIEENSKNPAVLASGRQTR